MQGDDNQYNRSEVFVCLPCAEGCEFCEDSSPCVVSLNWVMRTAILIMSCVCICCLPVVVLFTWKYGNVKVRTYRFNSSLVSEVTYYPYICNVFSSDFGMSRIFVQCFIKVMVC